MRVLFVTWAWPSHFFPCVQLGWALRAAGHEVLVASQPSLTGAITGAGLPAAEVGRDVDVGAMAGRYFSWLVRQDRPVEWEEMRRWGTGNVITYKRIAEAMLDDTLDLARHWRPDLIVFDPTTYAGPLVAARLGIPAVRHIWGMDYTCRTREFEPEALADLCGRLGIPGVETLGDITVDPCPPSLQVEAPVERLTMRFVPYNGPAVVPDWLTRPAERPRICVVESSAVTRWGGPEAALTPVALEAFADVDADVVAVGTGAVPDGPLPPRARLVDRIALHLLLPDCDLLVHQGGGGAVMTALAAGVPQLVLPRFTDHVFNGRRISEAGAGRELFAGRATAELIRAEADLLLRDGGYRATAEKLRREMAEQPSAAEVADQLAELAGRES
ncbi:nucleotide disphospho-sugar-binding domain-containing protein [Streptomyces sp. NPDC056411]|uniref:nucleotide disphospho-sugar-binding domain-containing protein n=1 Tax=Streptomyces sp. NPDC056411 TaxID=3345813 RepID=UPI0035E152BA